MKEITPEGVVYTTQDPKTDKLIEHTIPANFTLWSTGIAMNPFTARVTDLLPNQVHKKVCCYMETWVLFLTENPGNIR